jgi:hypothetical protein
LAVPLPLHTTFLAGVDLGYLWNLTKEKSFDVIEQEILRVRVCKIESVMVNDLGLLLQPGSPAGLADFSREPLSQLIGKWSKSQRWPLFSTVFAFDHFSHD